MIRAYNKSDFDDIENIYNTSKIDEFKGEPFDITVTPLSKDKQMLDLFNTSEIYIYGEDKIAGFVGVKENYISWLFVHPNFRGQNVGKKLVSYALSTLNGEVTLSVAKSNIAAMSLYKSLGFSMIKEFTSKYQGNPLVVWKMGMKINNA